jgi:uncharacterized short protein YbdD (DUF466 family)
MRHRSMAALGDVPAADTKQPAALATRVRRALRVLRTIIGAPDYERYVAHMSVHHPECDVASRDEFMKQRLESRYSKPGSRCC